MLFIEAVQNDPDTSELHFALGNLFRRRGEYNRAVRVHEHLLSRGDLSSADRDRAPARLALDFLRRPARPRRGRPVPPGRHRRSSTRRGWRGWPSTSARAVAQAADHRGQDRRQREGDFGQRQAHHLCEQAQAAIAPGDPKEGRTPLDGKGHSRGTRKRPPADLAPLPAQRRRHGSAPGRHPAAPGGTGPGCALPWRLRCWKRPPPAGATTNGPCWRGRWNAPFARSADGGGPGERQRRAHYRARALVARNLAHEPPCGDAMAGGRAPGARGFHPAIQRALDQAAGFSCAAAAAWVSRRQHFLAMPRLPELGQLPGPPRRRTL